MIFTWETYLSLNCTLYMSNLDEKLIESLKNNQRSNKVIVLDNLVYSLQRAGGISTYWYELSSRLIRDKADVRFIQRLHL